MKEQTLILAPCEAKRLCDAVTNVAAWFIYLKTSPSFSSARKKEDVIIAIQAVGEQVSLILEVLNEASSVPF